jgi:hypothetical protein
MTPEGWVVNVAAILAAVVSAYQSRGAKQAAKAGRAEAGHAAEYSQLAADRSFSTSNGLATNTVATLVGIERDNKRTQEALTRIERSGEKTQSMLSEHISDHARADLRRNQ